MIKGQHILSTSANKVIGLMLCFCCAISVLKAQFSVAGDLAFTFKDSCLYFKPTDNDSLPVGSVYKAKLLSGPASGTFSLDSFAPFNASYCPNAGFVGIDSLVYRVCDTNVLVCKDAVIVMKTEAISNNNISFSGDMNHDGQVNALDYLFLANAMKLKGKRFPGRQTNWKANYASDWNEYLWGVDLKFADANGNGIIDTFDLSVIHQNMFKTRSDYKMNFYTYGFEKNKVLPVHTKMNKKTFAIGDTLSVEIYFGDSAGLSINDRDITGAAFTLTLNPDIATTLKNAKAWFVTSGNWITQSAPQKIETVARHSDRFAFDVALSKLNHIQYDKNQQQACNNLKLTLTTRDKLDPVQFADVYSSITGGTPPYTYAWSNGSSGANISGINNVFPSSHFLVATDVNGCAAGSQITLLDRSAGGRGLLGTLKVIIEDDIMQLANNQNSNIEFILEKIYLVDDQEPEFVQVENHHDKLKSLVNQIESNSGNKGIQLIHLGSGRIKVSVENGDKIEAVKVYDMMGRESDELLVIEDHTVTLTIKDSTTGIRCVVISTKNDKYSIKLNQ